MEEASKINNRLKILRQLEQIENNRWAISSTQSKAGFQKYQQHRRNQIDMLTPEDEKEKTVFDMLKEVPEKRTLFDKLRKGK